MSTKTRFHSSLQVKKMQRQIIKNATVVNKNRIFETDIAIENTQITKIEKNISLTVIEFCKVVVRS